MNTLFDIDELKVEESKETCRSCKFRFSAPLNSYSRKILQCCEHKKGNNNLGYKTIKVTDKACELFKRKD